MSKVKFIYNADNCKYEPVSHSNKQVFVNLAGLLGLALLFAVGMTYIYHANFTSLKESDLMARNQELKDNLEFLNSKLDLQKTHMSQFQKMDDNVYRTLLSLDPIPPTVRIAGVGGTNKFEDIENSEMENKAMVLGLYKKVEKIKGEMYIQTRSYDELEETLNVKKEMWASRPAITPMSREDIKKIGSGFGWRNHPTLGRVKFHWGLDITANTGNPIYASGNGKVVTAHYSTTYGYVVYIDHGFGYETRYAHMSAFNVKEGDAIKRGDLIGFIGSTGRSKGPHLHYEVLYKGEKINPLPYLSKNLSTEEFEKMIEDSHNSDLIMDY